MCEFSAEESVLYEKEVASLFAAPEGCFSPDSMRANDSSSTRGRKKSVKVAGPALLFMGNAGGWGYRLDAERT